MAAVFTQTEADKVSFGTRRAPCKLMFLLQTLRQRPATSLWYNEAISGGTVVFFCHQEWSQNRFRERKGFTCEGVRVHTITAIRAHFQDLEFNSIQI